MNLVGGSPDAKVGFLDDQAKIKAAISIVADAISRDSNIFQLVRQYRHGHSLGRQSVVSQSDLCHLFDDPMLGRILREAVQKTVATVGVTGTVKVSPQVAKSLSSSTQRIEKTEVSQDVHSSMKHEPTENVLYSDADLSDASSGDPRVHDLDETHYEDDWDENDAFTEHHMDQRRVSFSEKVQVQEIPRTSEENIDDLFYSERDIDQMFKEAEAENL